LKDIKKEALSLAWFILFLFHGAYMRLLKSVALTSLTTALFLLPFSLAYSIEGKTEIKKADICDGIPASTEDIRNLPFNSYSSTAGYDECVNRCVRGTLVGICNQMSGDRSIYIDGTKENFMQEIKDTCAQGTEALMKDNHACPLVNCGP
jgi:hypothetical protein